MDRNQRLTQVYSTFGDKLLQHLPVLTDIQVARRFRPITIQLSPTEACDSDCPFCSVSGRPLKSRMNWSDIEQILATFASMGAGALEITGGGNPMLWKDPSAGIDANSMVAPMNINAIIGLAASLRYKIGLITNSHNLSALTAKSAEYLQWVRISLIKLDEGKQPEDYTFGHVPPEKIGLSYIIYDGTESSPRLKRPYVGTTPETIERIARLVALHPQIKFVRIAGDCLKKGSHPEVKAKWGPVIESVDAYDKFFVKEIGTQDGPYDAACYVGLLRPYIAAHPMGDGRPQVYICTSHVLNERVYSLDYSLGDIDHIQDIWREANTRFAQGQPPYAVKGNCGTEWEKTCKFCYYGPSNAVVDKIAHRTPDWEFA